MPLRMGQRGVGSGRANWQFSWRARLAKSLGPQMLGETKLSQLIDTKTARLNLGQETGLPRRTQEVSRGYQSREWMCIKQVKTPRMRVLMCTSSPGISFDLWQ